LLEVLQQCSVPAHLSHTPPTVPHFRSVVPKMQLPVLVSQQLALVQPPFDALQSLPQALPAPVRSLVVVQPLPPLHSVMLAQTQTWAVLLQEWPRLDALQSPVTVQPQLPPPVTARHLVPNSLPLQEWQTSPSKPQVAAAVPTLHMPPVQQPVLHLSGWTVPQLGLQVWSVWQAWFTGQSLKPVQATQAPWKQRCLPATPAQWVSEAHWTQPPAVQ
jgi:hypothetical protein